MPTDPASESTFGRTSLRVTRLGVGTVPIGDFGEPVSDEDAEQTLRRAYGLGVRFFDTAPLYGHGRAERRLGRFLATVPRGSYVLATKVGRLLRSDGQGWFFDFSYDGALRSFESSLERLGVARVDVLHIHDPDDHYAEALQGAYRALERLRGEGVIGAIGAGMNQAEMLARFARDTDMNCFLLAGRYTLLEQHALDELLPLCEQKGISIVIGGVFNSGILANPLPGATYNYRPADAAQLERATRIEHMCERHGVPLKAAVLQLPLAHPAVATVLTGVRTPAEIEENARMFQVAIPGALWHELKGAGLLRQDAPVPA
jgi:D-threo-aldose 1-dehydrogenase